MVSVMSVTQPGRTAVKLVGVRPHGAQHVLGVACLKEPYECDLAASQEIQVVKTDSSAAQ